MVSTKRNVDLLFVVTFAYIITNVYCNSKALEENKSKAILKFDASEKNPSATEDEQARNDSCPPTKVVASFSRKCPLPSDCEDYMRMGYNMSAVYRIWPRNKIMNGHSIQVYCDMDTDKGGWTVIQRRGNFLRPEDFFNKNWETYKKGFGDIERDFWLGNDNIFALTNQKQYSVRFDIADVSGNKSYALYDKFYIQDESQKYNLTIEDYSGIANDSMQYHNGKYFSTIDVDNDDSDYFSCANVYRSGWWFFECYRANLNGLYRRGQSYGVDWWTWRGLDKSEIKIRTKDFRRSLA